MLVGVIEEKRYLEDRKDNQNFSFQQGKHSQTLEGKIKLNCL